MLGTLYLLTVARNSYVITSSTPFLSSFPRLKKLVWNWMIEIMSCIPILVRIWPTNSVTIFIKILRTYEHVEKVPKTGYEPNAKMWI